MRDYTIGGSGTRWNFVQEEEEEVSPWALIVVVISIMEEEEGEGDNIARLTFEGYPPTRFNA
jgi:hypothetical protein